MLFYVRIDRNSVLSDLYVICVRFYVLCSQQFYITVPSCAKQHGLSCFWSLFFDFDQLFLKIHFKHSICFIQNQRLNILKFVSSSPCDVVMKSAWGCNNYIGTSCLKELFPLWCSTKQVCCA